MTRIEPVTHPARKIRALPRAEIEKILGVIPATQPRDRLLFRLLFETGLRVSEGLALYVEDLDLTLDDEHVTVQGKRGKRRTVLLDDPRLVAQLRTYLKITDYKHGPLFRAQKNGQGGPLRYQSVQQRWQNYCEAAGVSCTLHQLRHSHATELVNDGVSLVTIRKRLGHKNIQTTLHYAEQSDETADAELQARRRQIYAERSRGKGISFMVEDKLLWQGTVIAVQPRIQLTRSFDQRYHSYLGYMLRLQGQIGDDEGEFLVGIGETAQAKHQFRVGDRISGRSEPVANPKLEPADYYKTAGLKVIERAHGDGEHTPPPWYGVPSEMEVYRWRGHRRLSAQTYNTKCSGCIWGCRMAVEMIVDQWDPRQKRYRSETFCYGPKSCPLYKAGPTRKVPGRKGMVWEEEEWVDEDATSHRMMDE